MTDKRPDLDRLRRQVMSLSEAAAAARYIEQLEAAIEFPPRQPSPRAMEMACQRELRTERDRAEKAEAAASDFAKLLDGIAHRPWSNTAAGTARDALARHSEYAPGGESSQGGQR